MEIEKINPWNKNNKLITQKEIQNILSHFDINIPINNLSIYQRAFVHKSYIKNNKSDKILEEKPDDCLDLQELSNERLEYLGDAILSASIASYLYERFPNDNEGFLTRMRTKLVCGDMLGDLALKMNLKKHIIISKYVEEKCNGRNSIKILEDIFESLIGAIYLDFNNLNLEYSNLDFYSSFGFQICQLFIINIIEDFVDFSDLILNDYNFKDKLIKYYQNKYKIYPKFKEVLVEGTHNDRQYTVCITDKDNNVLAYGKHKTKKKAEQEASKKAIQKLGI